MRFLERPRKQWLLRVAAAVALAVPAAAQVPLAVAGFAGVLLAVVLFEFAGVLLAVVLFENQRCSLLWWFLPSREFLLDEFK